MRHKLESNVVQARKSGDFASALLDFRIPLKFPNFGQNIHKKWMSGDFHSNKMRHFGGKKPKFGHTSYCEEEIKRNNWKSNRRTIAKGFKFIGSAYCKKISI